MGALMASSISKISPRSTETRGSYRSRSAGPRAHRFSRMRNGTVWLATNVESRGRDRITWGSRGSMRIRAIPVARVI